MIKKLIALVLIFALVFPAVALAKGKPADTGKGAAVGRPDKPGKPESPGKSGEKKVVKPGQEPGEGEGPSEHGKKSNVNEGKPTTPGAKGRVNAINRIWAHILRILEILKTNPFSPKGNALRGLTKAIPNIAKNAPGILDIDNVGYILDNLPSPTLKENKPEEPPTTEPIEQPAEQF